MIISLMFVAANRTARGLPCAVDDFLYLSGK